MLVVWVLRVEQRDECLMRGQGPRYSREELLYSVRTTVYGLMTGDGSVALKQAASPKSLLVVVAAAGVPSESAIAEAELARTATNLKRPLGLQRIQKNERPWVRPVFLASILPVGGH